MKTLKEWRDQLGAEIDDVVSFIRNHGEHTDFVNVTRMMADGLAGQWRAYKLATDALYATIDRNLSEACATLTTVLGGIIIQKSIAPDGPPGVDMEAQREAAMWRWLVCNALDPQGSIARGRLKFVCSARGLGIDLYKAVAFRLDNPYADDAMILKFLSDNKVATPTMCDCDCHKAGVSMFHAVPCCDFTYQKRTKP